MTKGLHNKNIRSFNKRAPRSLLTHTTVLLSEVPSLSVLICQAEIHMLNIAVMWELNF